MLARVCAADAPTRGSASGCTVELTKQKVDSILLKVVAGARVSWTGDAGHSDELESTGAVGRRGGVDNGVGSAAVGVRWVPIP